MVIYCCVSNTSVIWCPTQVKDGLNNDEEWLWQIAAHHSSNFVEVSTPMPIYSFKIEVVIPLHRKRGSDELSIVIPGLVVAPNRKQAQEHAEKIGRGMMRGSRYNEWVDIYQLELQVGRKSKGKMYWVVTGVREVDEVFVQNCYGMNGIYLAPKANDEPQVHLFPPQLQPTNENSEIVPT